MAEIQAFFSDDEVSSLTGLSKSRLRYWDRSGFYSPDYVIDRRRAYSFRDLVALRAIAPIRKRISLQALRKMSDILHEDYEAPWSRLKFYFAGDELVYQESDSLEKLSAKHPGQEVMPVDLEEVRRTTEAAIERSRREDSVGRVTRISDVMRNAPVLEGTRVTTCAIWDFYSAGYTTEQILREYPGLNRRDVIAAIRHERKGRRKAS